MTEDFWPASRIDFVTEQDGVPEREFKALIRPALDPAIVLRAYLCTVLYDHEDVGVALGLRFANDVVDEQTIKGIADTFHGLFSCDQALDIIPLSEEDESRVGDVADPFFDATQPL